MFGLCVPERDLYLTATKLSDSEVTGGKLLHLRQWVA